MRGLIGVIWTLARNRSRLSPGTGGTYLGDDDTGAVVGRSEPEPITQSYCQLAAHAITRIKSRTLPALGAGEGGWLWQR